MANSTWIETKRDADLDESGNAVVKKVQLEPAGFTGKYRVDLILRIIGLAAIITPIILVYLQQRASLNTQKAIQQMEVYSQTATELSSICRRPITSRDFAASKEKLAYNLPPRIAFLFSEEISSDIEQINLEIPVYEAIGNNVLVLDSLYIHGNESGSSVSSYRNESTVAFEDSLEVAAHIRVIDSCRRELIYWYKILQDFQTNSLLTDTTIKKLIGQMVALDEQVLQTCTGFCDDLFMAYSILKEGQSPVAPMNQPVFQSLRQRHQRYLQTQPAMAASYKSILETTRKTLESKMKDLQLQMRKTNNAFQD